MVDEPSNLAGAAADAVDPDEVLAFTRALIAARSENPGGTEDEAADVAVTILRGLGADPDDRALGRGTPQRGRRDRGRRPDRTWRGTATSTSCRPDRPTPGRRDPWAGAIDDGRLVGRGSADMKGPIGAALAAAAALVRSGVERRGTLVFHLAADEELAGIHGTKVLWERGLLDQDACIVGEPSELQLGLAERGGAWFTATAYGKAAHGSQPHRGVNAITSMARFLLRLPEVLPDLEHPLTGRPTVNAALITGGSAPNVVPDRCQVDIDRRISPGETDPEQVRAPFLALVADLQRDHPELDDRRRASRMDRRRRGLPRHRDRPDRPGRRRGPDRVRTGFVGFTGITDARFYINQAEIPTVILGPGSLTVAHTAGESIDVDELVAGARSYARIFATFLGALNAGRTRLAGVSLMHVDASRTPPGAHRHGRSRAQSRAARRA